MLTLNLRGRPGRAPVDRFLQFGAEAGDEEVADDAGMTKLPLSFFPDNFNFLFSYLKQWLQDPVYNCGCQKHG